MRVEGFRIDGVGRLGLGEELLVEVFLRFWSKGIGGGEVRIEKVFFRGMGELGGKIIWEEERRERDEEG